MKTNESINARLNATIAPYEAQLNQAKAQNELATQRLSDNNSRALQEAYIQAQQARRVLPQQMAAIGLNGGPAETSLVRLQNNYQSNRNSQERAYQDRLADLELSYYNTQQDIGARIAAAKAQADAERAELAAARVPVPTPTPTPAKEKLGYTGERNTVVSDYGMPELLAAGYTLPKEKRRLMYLPDGKPYYDYY